MFGLSTPARKGGELMHTCTHQLIPQYHLLPRALSALSVFGSTSSISFISPMPQTNAGIQKTGIVRVYCNNLHRVCIFFFWNSDCANSTDALADSHQHLHSCLVAMCIANRCTRLTLGLVHLDKWSQQTVHSELDLWSSVPIIIFVVHSDTGSSDGNDAVRARLMFTGAFFFA